MQIAIREAALIDAPDIVRLISEHAASADETTPLTSAYVEQYLASPSSRILLAEANQQIVGLLSWSMRPDLYHAGNACLVEELIVTENMRNQGLGGALVSELFLRLAGTRCVELSVTIMPNNQQAMRFYRAHGLCDEGLLLEMHLNA